MKNVNELVICQDDYASREDFENAIKKAIVVLLDNRYIMTVRYDEPSLGIVCINYGHDDQSFGCDYPYWLSPTEWESIVWDNEVEQ